MGALLGSVVLANACGGPAYTYVKNPDSNAFFRVPHGWTLFSEDEVLDSQVQDLSPQGAEATRAAVWIAAFDGDPNASLGHVLQANSRYPEGFAQTRPLSDQERDSFSLSSIRNALFPLDQLTATGSEQVEMLSSEHLVQKDGFRGLHLVFNIRRGSDFLTVNQTGLIDSATEKLYLFVIGCEAHCYIRHQKLIDQIVSSWTVKER